MHGEDEELLQGVTPEEVLGDEFLQGLSEAEQLLWAEVFLGQETWRFLKENSIGRYLNQIASARHYEAMKGLRDSPFTDTKQVMELQVQARSARMVLDLLNEAVIKGQQAEREIELNHNEE